MKTIIAITHLVEDTQVDLVSHYAKKRNIGIVPICTNTVSFGSIALHQKRNRISLYSGKKLIVPAGLWFATYPREDTLYSGKMSKYPYPGEYRSTVFQFVNDLRYAFSSIPHMPGVFDSILKADSKLYVFKEAFKIGLRIPSETFNSNLETKRIMLGNRAQYRKKLGFPSVVSFSCLSKKEEMITTTNSATVKDSSFLLWQWQTLVESIAHVRGFVVEDKSWFVSWKRESNLSLTIDLREGVEEREWIPFTMPESVSNKLTKLCKKLGIRFCCPEFLLNKKGELTLIDINPCGDWRGFFSDNTSNKIASAIASLF